MPNLGPPRRKLNTVLLRSKQVGATPTVSLYQDTWEKQEIKTKSSVPNWKSKIRSGLDATGTYTRLFVDFDQSDSSSGLFSLTRTDPFRGWQLTSTIYGDFSVGTSYPDPAFLDPAASDNLALTSVYRKIRAEQVKMSGLTFLGELREAIHMIKSPAKSLRTAVTNYVGSCRSRTRGLKRNSDKLHHVLSDTWLEHRFGWKPFFSDISDGIAAYNNVFARSPRTVVKGTGVTNGVEESFLKYQYLQGQAGVPWFWMDRHIRSDLESSSKYTVGLSSVRKGNKADDLFDSFGFKVDEFVPTVWELIPYSFLVDYFSNIGDILSAAATDTSGVLWVCLSRKRQVITNFVFTPDVPKSIGAIATGGFKGDGGASGSQQARVKKVQYDRTSTGLTVPRFTVTYPGEGSLQWLNIAALAASRFL